MMEETYHVALMLVPTGDRTPPVSPRNLWIFGVLLFVVIAILVMISPAYRPRLLSDPFLQLPTENSVRVVWFTEFPGSRHTVNYGADLERVAIASTTQLSRTREDQNSRVGSQTEDNLVYAEPTPRSIWRHEAEITGLTPGMRVPYRVNSIKNNDIAVRSEVFTLAPTPPPETPLKILLTSDHQLKPMTAANLQKVAETVDIDAVFIAGDLVNIPDRASEWFDDNRGGAFFPGLQGKASYVLEKNGTRTTYRGGALIQNVPLFPAIGNHEIMGRFSTERGLNDQFNDAYPRFAAGRLYRQAAEIINPQSDPEIKAKWIKNNSFNSDTYDEIFSLPNGDKNYYAVTFGDVRLVVLYATNIWRVPHLDANARGRYREREADFNRPENWGYGQHIFEPISAGSEQYRWLQRELESPEFKRAKYKVAMFHHPPHSLGDNIVPAYTDPVQIRERDNSGNITMIRYEYPKTEDYLIRDVIPLLEKAGVQLVYYGHSHLWNRFVGSDGMHFLESSNVGNTYGAYLDEKRRFVPPAFTETYTAFGDPNGLEPVTPTLDPTVGKNGKPRPYIASNDITIFSILDTGNGTVGSYYFDTRKPDSQVVKFDEFALEE